MFDQEELLVDVPVSASQGLLSYRIATEHKLAFYKVPLLAFLKPRSRDRHHSTTRRRSKQDKAKSGLPVKVEQQV